MTKLWPALYRLFAREPVQLGAMTLSFVAWAFKPDDLGMAFAIQAVGWAQRMFSAPKRAVEQAKEQGYNAAIADVSSLIKPPPIKEVNQ